MVSPTASIELVPQQFCVKYNPPILGIIYHLTNNIQARFVHNVEINLNEEMDPKHITTHLFQTENMYLNKNFVSFNQVEKLIRKIAMHTNSLRKNVLSKVPIPQQNDDTQKSLARQRLLKRKGLAGMNMNNQVEQQPKEQEDAKKNQVKKLQEQNQIMSRNVEENKQQQMEEVDDFVDEDFEDFDDLPFENNDKGEEKKNLQNNMGDDNEQHQINKVDDKNQQQEQILQQQQQQQLLQQQQYSDLQANAAGVNVNGDDEEVGDEPSGESQQFITINDVQYRKIQIQGDQEEYLMDPQGNIFDLNGTFIGTANSSALQQQNEEQGEINDVDQ